MRKKALFNYYFFRQSQKRKIKSSTLLFNVSFAMTMPGCKPMKSHMLVGIILCSVMNLTVVIDLILRKGFVNICEKITVVSDCWLTLTTVRV